MGAGDPCPTAFNMARYVLADAAQRLPEMPALIVTDGANPETAREVWRFAEVELAVRRVAGALLSRGLQRGERVLIRVGDTPQFPAAYFGVIAAGGIAMPLSSQLSADELSYIAADAEPRFALLDETCPEFTTDATRLRGDDLRGETADFANTDKDDPAVLVYTSGTSGRAKGVLHAQRSVWARRMMRAGWHDIGPEDRVLHTGAFNWTYVLGCGLADPWSVGATAILNTGDRSPEVWPGLAAQWQPTVFAAVPGLYRRLIKYGDNLRGSFASLRHGLTAGESLSADIREAWEAETGKPLYEALGMSEVSTFVSSGPGQDVPPGYMGVAQPGRRIAVLDENSAPLPADEAGVLAVHRSDPGLMLGYWRDAERTAAAYRGEWFVTGDRAEMSAAGAVAYLGRDDDMMNAQGYRVAPQEVERVLALHPAVTECAVTDITVKEGVSIIAAWVVTRDAVDADGLRAHCGDHLASYKMPRAFYRLDSLPRTANGKVQRKALRGVQASSL